MLLIGGSEITGGGLCCPCFVGVCEDAVGDFFRTQSTGTINYLIKTITIWTYKKKIGVKLKF